MSLILSWVETANVPNNPFPLNNLPYGVFSTKKDGPRCGVRIGDMILDLKTMETEGHINFGGVFESPYWNDFIALGEEKWTELRQRLIEYLHNQQNVGVDDRDAVSCRRPCGFHTDFLNIWWCSPLTLVFFLLAVRTGTLPCTTRREVGTSSRRPC